jgi:hypothetical protein
MAIHSGMSILERALQALQEYERHQSGLCGIGFSHEHESRSPVHALGGADSKSQVFRWVEARCARRDDVWGAEKFLWRDYAAWSEQSRQTPCSLELFCDSLSGSFVRESDGWLGIALADDVVASGYIM